MKNLPLQVDLRLLAFRIGIGGMLFINHGIEKIFHYDEMLRWFPDPFDIGRLPGFIVAFSADVLCSLLIIFGLYIRIASIFVAFNLLVGLIFVHGANLRDIHGELIICYLSAMVILFSTGAGKLSLDHFFFQSNNNREQDKN